MTAAFRHKPKPRQSNSLLLHSPNDIPSSLLKDLPFLLPTFTRRTSGHWLGPLTETNISCSHGNDNNVLPLTGSPLLLFKRLAIYDLNGFISHLESQKTVTFELTLLIYNFNVTAPTDYYWQLQLIVTDSSNWLLLYLMNATDSSYWLLLTAPTDLLTAPTDLLRVPTDSSYWLLLTAPTDCYCTCIMQPVAPTDC